MSFWAKNAGVRVDAFGEHIPASGVTYDYDVAVTIVREPLARLHSEYRWQEGRPGRQGRPRGFHWWVAETLTVPATGRLRPQVDYLLPDVEVFRFEDGLEPVTRRIADVLGVEWSEPRRENVHVPRNQNYALPPWQMQRVRRAYAEDYARLGYQ